MGIVINLNFEGPEDNDPSRPDTTMPRMSRSEDGDYQGSIDNIDFTVKRNPNNKREWVATAKHRGTLYRKAARTRRAAVAALTSEITKGRIDPGYDEFKSRMKEMYPESDPFDPQTQAYSESEGFEYNTFDSALPEPETPSPQEFDARTDSYITEPPEAPESTSVDDPNAPRLNDNTTPEEKRRMEKERRRLLMEKKRAIRDAYAQATKEVRRNLKDASRSLRQRIADARAKRTSDRVQYYGLAASMGAPGYLVSALVDHYYLNPQTENEIREFRHELDMLEEQFRRTMDYHKQIKDNQMANLENPPIDAEVVNPYNSSPYGPNDPPDINQSPPDITQPPTAPLPMGGSGSGSGGGGGGSGGGTGPGNTGGGNTGGGGNPNTNVPPKVRNPLWPPATTTSPTFTTAAYVTAGLYVSHELDKTRRSAYSSATESMNNLQNSNYMGAVGSASKGITDLGIGPVKPFKFIEPELNMIIQSLEAIENHTHVLMENAIGAMPATLQQNVENDLELMMQQMNNAKQVDPIASAIIKAEGKVEKAFDNLMATLMQLFGPFLASVLNGLSVVIRALEMLIDIGITALRFAGNMMRFNVWGAVDELVSLGKRILNRNDGGLEVDILDKFKTFMAPTMTARDAFLAKNRKK